MLRATTSLIRNVTSKNIIVVNHNDVSQTWTGKDAVAILNTSPYVMLVGERDSANKIKANLFDQFITANTIVFIVDYNNL